MACQFHDCIIVVDLRKLEDRDSWFWKNDKSYVVPGNENGPFKKCNDKKVHHIPLKIEYTSGRL